eukprot:6012419-Ditylum_brightwellii.AAC.1
MTDQTSVTHGTHGTCNNKEYEDQLVWEANGDERIGNDNEDLLMEPAKETGEKRKAEEKTEQTAKQRKNE